MEDDIGAIRRNGRRRRRGKKNEKRRKRFKILDERSAADGPYGAPPGDSLRPRCTAVVCPAVVGAACCHWHSCCTCCYARGRVDEVIQSQLLSPVIM